MIAGTGAEHHRFAPVLALFGFVKTAAKRRRGLGTMSPKWVWAIAQRIPLIREQYRFRAECEAFYD